MVLQVYSNALNRGLAHFQELYESDHWYRSYINQGYEEAGWTYSQYRFSISGAVYPSISPLDFIGGGGARLLAGEAATRGMPAALRAGQIAEAAALDAIGSAGKVVFTPTAEQIESAAFKVIVGDAKYTASGAPVSTIFDATTGAGLGEIKSGSSVLNSSYQLRLQTYGALINNRAYTIYTSRPVNVTFGAWLERWGVTVKPLP